MAPGIYWNNPRICWEMLQEPLCAHTCTNVAGPVSFLIIGCSQSLPQEPGRLFLHLWVWEVDKQQGQEAERLSFLSLGLSQDNLGWRRVTTKCQIPSCHQGL